MLSPEMPQRKPGATARLQHQSFFEALQHGEGTRDWMASRAGLIVLRYVLARSDIEWETGALAAEERRVAAVVDALPVGDPERVALQAILHAVSAAFHPTTARPTEPDARPDPRQAEAAAQALIAYGDTLVARSAWPLAADVYATVWDTRAAPDSRFGGGIDPRDADDAPDEPGASDAPDSERIRDIAPSSAVAALRLAICYRMLGRTAEAREALGAAKAAAIQCRDAELGEYIECRARLGEILILLDAGPSADAERQLGMLVAECAANPRLRDLHARTRHAQAVAVYRRRRGSR
jgi:hypothetical protein